MNREDIENVIIFLQAMLDQEHYRESDYQTFFEENEFIFRLLNYKSVISHPILERPEGPNFIPDFMVQKINDSWEIFELKRPDTKLLNDVSRRGRFYAAMQSYISQCNDYSEYFDDQHSRDLFAKRYGVQVHKRPTAILVAGRNEGLARHELLKHTQRYNGIVQLQTFDDILNSIDFFRIHNFGDTDRKRGILIIFIFKVELGFSDECAYIFDIGRERERNRVTMYADKQGRLVLRVIDASSFSHQFRVSEEGDNILGRIMYCSIEIATNSDNSIVLCEMDGSYVSEVKTKNLHIEFSWPVAIVIGADVNGSAGSIVTMYTALARDKTLSLEEKGNVKAYMYDTFGEYIGKTREIALSRIVYGQGQYHYSRGHPMLAQNLSQVSNDMIQENNAIRPMRFTEDGRKEPVGMAKSVV